MEKQKSFVYTENLTVGYDGKPLIRDIRLSLEKGQILTLIGPNGAGKSTILKSLIRQLKLVGGAVWLDNTSMERMTDKEISRKMAVVMTERIHPVEEKLLFAEYAIDFAMQAADRALLISMEAAEAEQAKMEEQCITPKRRTVR